MRISDWSADVCSADLPFEFRCERHRAIGETDIVKRLHPQPIAREEQAAARMIVDRESEHAVEARQAVGAPLAPRGDDDFGIAASAETMAAILEFGAQLAEIVDLTIIGERDELVIARHRLRAALDIDDRETEMRKADAGRRPFARPVGAADRKSTRLNSSH